MANSAQSKAARANCQAESWWLVFFRKANTVNNKHNDCYSNTKITNLPVTKSVINGNNVWNQLECSIGNLETKDYLRLPDINNIKVFIIGNFNFDDFTYTLVTLKNDKVVTLKGIGFAEVGEDRNSISNITEFNINDDYILSLDTKTRNGDNWKTLKKEKLCPKQVCI